MTINSFLFQGGGTVAVDTLLASPYDLLIVESGETSATSPRALSPNGLSRLQDDGRTVIAYMNAIVLDENRQYYVDAGLTDPDIGPFSGPLPSWLDVDSEGNPLAANSFGAFADITDPGWIDILSTDAKAIIDAGYDGIFLDDVGAYFELATQRGDFTFAQAADAMMALVNAIVDEIGPEPFIAINRGAFIFGDAGASSEAADFRANVDALLMESQISTGAWGAAQTQFAPGTLYLAIEVEGNLTAEAFSAQAAAEGLIPFMPPSDAYDTVPPAPLPDENGPGTATTISGSAASELILGTDGDDIIWAFGGHDTVYGFGGDDTILGDDGRDVIFGGEGRDSLIAGGGSDIIYGGEDRDVLRGQRGNDTLFGEEARDRLFGGGNNDLLVGGRNADTIDPGNGNDTIFDDDLPMRTMPSADDWL